MEPLLSKEEREAFLIEREKRVEQQYKTGKIIVSTIAVTYIVFTIIGVILSLNILSLIINISAACALFFGVKWVRIYYAIAVGTGVLLFLAVLFNPGAMSQIPVWAVIITILQLAFGIVSSILLFRSESVIEFMEVQRELP